VRSPLKLPYYVILGVFSVGMVAVLCGVGGDDPSRVSVAGIVKVDGKPLAGGNIRFIMSTPSDQLHVDVSLVQEGEYAIPNSELLIPGRYEIQIRSDAQEAASRNFKRNADAIPPEQRFRVPSQYNEESVLQVDIQRGGLSRFDFDLKG